MKRSMFRNIATAAALILMISLAGCMLVFTVVGSDVYDVYSTGVTNGPIAVDVTAKGFWPVWPDTLNATISGTVNPVGTPSNALVGTDIALANKIESDLYDALYNDGVNEYESVTAEELLTDDVFRVNVVMAIPGLKELMTKGGATSTWAYNDVSLEDLLSEPRYNELVADLQNACANIPEGNVVRTTFEGSLKNGAKVIGDFSITFLLHGSGLII